MPTLSPELAELLFLLRLLAGDSAIYRGEPEHYEQVSSGLYRQLHAVDYGWFDISEAQQRQIEVARRYSQVSDRNELLTMIQHLGGKTNLIDFTLDVNIALFFAANYSPDKDGRVILKSLPFMRTENYTYVTTGTPSNMADVQKSVWVEPKRGYISDGDITIVSVARSIKSEIKEYLRIMYGVE